MRNFRIVLTPEELNAVIRGLEGLTYRDAHPVLQQIHGQAQSQVVASQAKAAAKAKATPPADKL